jgi:hypothetical protein
MTVIQPWRPGSNRLWGEASISPGYVEAWESSLEFGQIQLGINVYGDLRGMSGPDSPSIRLVHAAPNSTSVPMKHKGHGPAVISGTHLVDGDDLVAFINDIRDGSAERKIMWLLGTEPVYGWVYSGDITGISPVNFYGTAARKYDVSWRFILSRSKVYWTADDTVAWGS